jgi:PPM family protein phosphatase
VIKISSQGFISELGKRENNEDNCAFKKGSTYVLCDGVGGGEKGEIASDLVVHTFIEEFEGNPMADANLVLIKAENNITEYIKNHPEADGMATTLTFSQVREDGIYIAWCGDSRIYQFRDGKTIFETTDHSWVNEAIKSGIITTDEAINHPKSNVITRAVQGNHKPVLSDTLLLTDIQANDLFLHCSDGVLESWSDDDLIALFSSENDPEKILEIIKKDCSLHSKDNFTAIVYRVEEAVLKQKNVPPASKEVEAIPLSENDLIGSIPIDKRGTGILKLLKRKILGIPLILFLVAIIPFIIFLLINTLKKEPANNQDNTVLPANTEIQQPVKETPQIQPVDTLHKSNVSNKPGNKTDINNAAAKPAVTPIKNTKKKGKQK